MSAYSTLRITRSVARNRLLATILDSNDDELLKDFLDGFLRHRCYECIIVDDNEENDNEVL